MWQDCYKHFMLPFRLVLEHRKLMYFTSIWDSHCNMVADEHAEEWCKHIFQTQEKQMFILQCKVHLKYLFSAHMGNTVCTDLTNEVTFPLRIFIVILSEMCICYQTLLTILLAETWLCRLVAILCLYSTVWYTGVTLTFTPAQIQLHIC